ncbi:unnamed protein product [Adineta steineri]|uniref:Uncharacterized protein n=1 Tax=Adineta steineri TaxID=433720 RepID=A0A815KRW8_9BILA|nr:unnamed protein product [Adineta steineri]CAF1399447.1 unnamed protein product [Adineta steineri]
MDLFSINQDNLPVTTLYWLDSNPNNAQQFEHDLRTIVNIDELKIFENPNECRESVILSTDKTLVLIVSGCFVVQLIPYIHDLKQVSAIYVYCSNIEFYLQWSKIYKKVKDVLTHRDDLIQRIYTDNKYRQLVGNINFFHHHEQSHENLRSQNVVFVYQQLFIEILLRLKRQESCNNDELIAYLYQKFADNSSECRKIEEFQQVYRVNESIQWYTRPGCIFAHLNAALRKWDLQIVVRYRFFIKNLYQQLKDEYARQRNTTLSDIKHVYRGQRFSFHEIQQLQNAIGQYISFNSFLSTTKDENVAMIFAGDDPQLAVLFHIEIQTNIDRSTKPFASISHLSHIGLGDEEEVLFMLGTIFRVKSFGKRLAEDSHWILELELANENEHCLKEFGHYRQEELPRETSLANLQSLLLEMNGSSISTTTNIVEQEQYDKSSLWINLLHGVVKIIQTPFGNDTHLSIKPLTSLALTHCNNGDYKLAIEQLNKCLSIHQANPATNDSTSLCDTLDNFALVYKKMADYETALSYSSQSLYIRERNPVSHNLSVTLAESYMTISDLYLALKDYYSALEFRQLKALPIYVNIQSTSKSHQLKLALLYCSIGVIYEEMKNYNAALDNYKQAFQIYENIYPFHRNNDAFYHHNAEMKDITPRLMRMIHMTKRNDELTLIDGYYGEFNDEREEAQRMYSTTLFHSTY